MAGQQAVSYDRQLWLAKRRADLAKDRIDALEKKLKKEREKVSTLRDANRIASENFKAIENELLTRLKENEMFTVSLERDVEVLKGRIESMKAGRSEAATRHARMLTHISELQGRVRELQSELVQTIGIVNKSCPNCQKKGASDAC